uniref:V-ATPase proteolipid subunit C-like domain-containing protein n=1 Tax=Vitis vinifera TaxID=29760 RepID=F6I1K2_VITVI
MVCTLLEGIRSLKGRNRVMNNMHKASGHSILSVIFCEVVAIYGVIVAIILQTKLESVPASNIYAPESLRVGYAIFASGIIMGFANLVCGSLVQMIFLYVGSCRRRWTTTINEQLEGSF